MKSSILHWKFFRVSLLWTLLLGGVITSCSKDDDPAPVSVDKAALAAAIATAQGLITNTVEGTRPGEYEIGSKAPLQTALTASNVVYLNASATQSSVNNTTAQLLAAIAEYQSHRINEIAAASLVGFWKMNGNANDSSGNNNNGVVSTGHPLYGAGTPSLTADRFGRANMAYNFDHGGNIEVPYASALNPQQISISLWCKKDTLGRTWDQSTYTLASLSRWYGYKFQFQGTNRAFFTVRTIRNAGDTGFIDHDGNLGLNNSTWYHVAVTFKADTMKFYVNGALTATWTGADAPGNPIQLASPVNFVIGQDLPTTVYSSDINSPFYVNYGGFWTGQIDDFMLYNVALDGPQIASIYSNQNTP